jgi:rod shape-determining protein MreD
MVDPVAARTWGYRALFAALVGVIAVLRLMPVGAGPGGLPGPDLVLAVTLAWVLRRPGYVPAWLVVALFLPLDLITGAPPGLGALAVLLATEFLRARQSLARSLPFPLEWALVTGVLLLMVAGLQAALALAVLPRPPLGLDLLRALFTAAVYPAAVGLTVWGFGVRRPAPGDIDAAGARA